jgi:hypothetical protein
MTAYRKWKTINEQQPCTVCAQRKRMLWTKLQLMACACTTAYVAISGLESIGPPPEPYYVWHPALAIGVVSLALAVWAFIQIMAEWSANSNRW